MKEYLELKAEMIEAARNAYVLRLQSGDGGNLSVRIPDQELILIKTSGSSFRNLSRKDVVLVDFQGNTVEPDAKTPSRELYTHLEIYRKRPDVFSVFHSHSPWSVVCSQVYDAWPGVSLPLEMKIGAVPVLDAGDDHADGDVAARVGKLLEKFPGIRAFVQRKHGLFCMAAGITRAMYDAELVEETAQVAMTLLMAGRKGGK